MYLFPWDYIYSAPWPTEQLYSEFKGTVSQDSDSFKSAEPKALISEICKSYWSQYVRACNASLTKNGGKK